MRKEIFVIFIALILVAVAIGSLYLATANHITSGRIIIDGALINFNSITKN